MANEEEEIPAQAPEPQTETTTEPKPLTVDISDDDDGEDKGQQQGAAPDRPVRHKSDWRRMKERYEQDVAELRRELAEVRGRISAPQPQPQAAPVRQETDPVEAEIVGLSRQQDFILKAINAGTLGEGDQTNAVEEWRRLDRKRRALEYRKDNAAAQAPQVQTEDQMIGQLLRMEFPQVFDDDELRTRAEAEMLALMKRGRAKSLATGREACQRVAKRSTGLFGQPPAPTDAERARYSSVSSRAGSNGANGSQYTPNKQVLELARSYTSHREGLSDGDRVKIWVREVGKPAGLV